MISQCLSILTLYFLPSLYDFHSDIRPDFISCPPLSPSAFPPPDPFYFPRRVTKLSTTTSSGGLILALQRAITTARPEGRYRKHCYWLRYKAVLLESSLLESSRPKSFVPFALQLWMSVVNH